MGPIEWFKEQEPIVQLVLVGAIGFALVVFLLVGTVLGAAVIGTFVLDLGGEVDEPVGASAGLDVDHTDGAIRVTFADAETADTTLEVRISEETDDGTPYAGATAATLERPGDEVVFDGPGIEPGDEFAITVTAHAPPDRSRVLFSTVETI